VPQHCVRQITACATLSPLKPPSHVSRLQPALIPSAPRQSLTSLSPPHEVAIGTCHRLCSSLPCRAASHAITMPSIIAVVLGHPVLSVLHDLKHQPLQRVEEVPRHHQSRQDCLHDDSTSPVTSGLAVVRTPLSCHSSSTHEPAAKTTGRHHHR
jgi:hypothetical protein